MDLDAEAAPVAAEGGIHLMGAPAALACARLTVLSRTVDRSGAACL